MSQNDFRHMTNVLSEPDIRVYMGVWRDAPVVHVRKFVDGAKYSGPTKSGVMVPLDNCLELAQGILDVYNAECGTEHRIED